jgi:hypothetical protein
MKKSELRMIIREIVREEVAMSIQEVIKEIKEPTTQDIGKPLSKKKVVKKKHYSKNSVLNDVLNETAMSSKGDEWGTLGGSTYTADRMNEVVGSSYADMMNGSEKPNADTMVKSMGGDPNVVGDTLKNALTRDYSDLMKAIDKKK